MDIRYIFGTAAHAQEPIRWDFISEHAFFPLHEYIILIKISPHKNK